MLRNLSSYYYKDPVLLYLVKVSQGLVHMGKGLMTVSPYHTERQLLSGDEMRGTRRGEATETGEGCCKEPEWRAG